MNQQQASVPSQDLEVGEDLASTVLTDRHRSAVDDLQKVFGANRPVAVVLGEGRSASSSVIESFLSGLAGDVAVARVNEPCDSATEFMGKIISAVGFQPKDMTLEDLEGIFAMFLSFQKSHGHRTVVCIEQAQDSDLWVLDKIRSLVEYQIDGHFGLMILLAGQSGLKEALREGPLSAVSAVAGKRILLPRFTLAEAKTLIRQCLDSAGKPGIDQLFQYEAITLIHDLSKGVPDNVTDLVNCCLDLAAADCVELVTADLVRRAHDRSQAARTVNAGDDHGETVNMHGLEPPTGLLVLQLSGEDVREMTLRQGHTLIGRSQLCDVHVDVSTVSRRHALITYTPDGATLVDLNSTNGTFVDGRQVRRHALQPGETIEVGGTRIEYILDHKTVAQGRPLTAR